MDNHDQLINARHNEHDAQKPLVLQAGLSANVGSAQPDGSFVKEAKAASNAGSFLGLEENDDGLQGADLPQFTLKAVVAGICTGTFGCLLAIYYGLKTGITPSLNIISSLLGFVLVKGFLQVTGKSGTFTTQENAVIQTTATACFSVASASGFSSGLLGMGQAAADLTGQIPGSQGVVQLTWIHCFSFCISIAFFGFFIAFPLRDYMILKRKLTFPSGTATATVIRTMHADGETALKNFKVLMNWTGITTCWSMFVWLFKGLDSTPIFGTWMGSNGFVIDWDLGTFAIGALLSPIINLSILIGGVLGWGFLMPMLNAYHLCHAGENGVQPTLTPDGYTCWYYAANAAGEGGSPHYLDMKAYTLFPAIAMVVADGFWSIGKLAVMVLFAGQESNEEEESNENVTEAERQRNRKLVEIFHSASFPVWLTVGGFATATTVCVFVMQFVFDVPWYEALLGSGLTPLFATGIIVGIGLTDWDVSSSFGKMMMIPLGLWNKGGSVIPSLAVCQITISGCGAAGALIQDYKTGYLIGAHPKNLLKGQVCGAIAGCIIAPTMFELFNSAFVLPTDKPNAFITGIFGIIYRTLAATITGEGLEALPPMCLWFCLAAAIFTLIVDLCVEIGSKYNENLPAYVPNPMAMSIGLMLGPNVGMEFMFTGTLVWLWSRRNPQTAKEKSIVIASGCLAGSGVAILIRIALSLGNVNAPFRMPWE